MQHEISSRLAQLLRPQSQRPSAGCCWGVGLWLFEHTGGQAGGAARSRHSAHAHANRFVLASSRVFPLSSPRGTGRPSVGRVSTAAGAPPPLSRGPRHHSAAIVTAKIGQAGIHAAYVVTLVTACLQRFQTDSFKAIKCPHYNILLLSYKTTLAKIRNSAHRFH